MVVADTVQKKQLQATVMAVPATAEMIDPDLHAGVEQLKIAVA